MAIQIDPSQYKNLAIEAHDDGVHVVTLNRPSKRNALDSYTVEELVAYFSTAPRGPNVSHFFFPLHGHR